MWSELLKKLSSTPKASVLRLSWASDISKPSFQDVSNRTKRCRAVTHHFEHRGEGSTDHPFTVGLRRRAGGWYATVAAIPFGETFIPKQQGLQYEYIATGNTVQNALLCFALFVVHSTLPGASRAYNFCMRTIIALSRPLSTNHPFLDWFSTFTSCPL